MSTLYFEARKFKYFFDDCVENVKAPDFFKVALLTQLEVSLYEKGKVVIEYDKKVENMILISHGQCALYSYYKQDNDNYCRLKLCTLVE